MTDYPIGGPEPMIKIRLSYERCAETLSGADRQRIRAIADNIDRSNGFPGDAFRGSGIEAYGAGGWVFTAPSAGDFPREAAAALRRFANAIDDARTAAKFAKRDDAA